jgi:polyhydroxyalkanoate synthase
MNELAQAQAKYGEQVLALWASALNGGAAGSGQVVAADRGDRRFHAAGWNEKPLFSLLKQSYLLNSRFLSDLVESAELDSKEKRKLRFFARQFMDAMSPANFAVTNPEALGLAVESKGESLAKGWSSLLEDARRGRISITDESAFEVGRNVATSKGSVVFENEVFQLIQYAPLTEKVAARPLLIVPPCINKYYILDLQPENSFVRFCCEQGLTVFLVSWRNPDSSMAGTTWDDYVANGAIEAIKQTRAACSADKINAVGWCVGGTILSCALAILKEKGSEAVASATLLTTMLDFDDPGDLGVFVDEASVAMREQTIGKSGLFSGRELGFVFQTLRANDLIWPYVVNNYLKGKTPEAFDLLYWNADATNLPGPMYAWYLRNMYLENRLCRPEQLDVCGVSLDLGRIDMPTYVLATVEDHIVPWQSAYQTTRLVGGTTQFVLGASGHIAGVVNPASKNKRSYWANGKLGGSAQVWKDSAQEFPGSWWTHWMGWLRKHAGKPVPARKRLGGGPCRPIEPAPGRYVKERVA